MADDFFGPPTDAAADVPAETQSDGSVTEDSTGEQVASEAGNASWYNSTYPGQIQNAPATAVDESAAETARLAQQNETATGTPTDISLESAGLPSATTATGGALTNYPNVPTQDAYGLTILDAAQTAQLTRNINPAFINSLVDPNSPQAQAGTNAVNTSATKLPVYVDSTGIVYDPVTLVSYPVDSAGKQIIPADVAASIDPAAQARINQFNQTPVMSATSVDTGAAAEQAAINRSIAADAARLNAQSPNPYLKEIDAAAASIAKTNERISQAEQNIQSAQQSISTSQSIIAKQTAELSDPYITDAQRAILEANNAEQAQFILTQTQAITEYQNYIAGAQEINQVNETVIDINTANYRATTSELTVPVVDVNNDPNFVGPQQITATVINPTTTAAAVDVNNDPNFVGPQQITATVINPTTTAAAVDVNTASLANVVATTAGATTTNVTAAEAAAIQTQVGRQLAQQQAVTAAQKKSVNNTDWRVRLSLAPGARYLYNDPDNPGILQPLALTSGVIFPYTPKIETAYKADYDSYALTHSNYKGYFYKSSYTDAVNMSATFTAQDTAEANYLLAVIHFFKSVTKMFYGQDAQRGAPPPLVYLTGLGEYQFSAHPCAVTSFTYSLPNDVDYIRARSTNINGANMLTRRDKQTVASDPISGAIGRLQNLFNSQGISYGAEICRPPPPTLGQNQPTYVPTRMEISISLLPIQSRQQVSRVFSLKQYANGDLLKGGFW